MTDGRTDGLAGKTHIAALYDGCSRHSAQSNISVSFRCDLLGVVACVMHYLYIFIRQGSRSTDSRCLRWPPVDIRTPSSLVTSYSVWRHSALTSRRTSHLTNHRRRYRISQGRVSNPSERGTGDQAPKAPRGMGSGE